MTKKRFSGIATATAVAALGAAVGFGTLGVSAGESRRDAEPTVDDLFDPKFLKRELCGRGGEENMTFFRPEFRALLAAADPTEETADMGPPLWEDTGDVTYPVTTANDVAQRFFDQGLRFSYGFNHAEAIRSFKKAQRLDPTCAMCYWGEAWALGPNINMAMAEEAVAPAFAAVSQAVALKDNASAKERDLIEALEQRYAADPSADRSDLDRAFADAMAVVAAKYPGDDTVQVIYAESIMDTDPWNYWGSDLRTPRKDFGKAIDAVEKVLDRSPDHMGAIHLYIHLMEASAMPEKAEPYADRLRGQEPTGLGHLVHMPSHIYYRIGRYIDSLRANQAAVEADEKFLKATGAQDIYALAYYPHNVHFVLVSAQMAGDRATVLKSAEKLNGVIPDEAAAVPLVQPIKSAPYYAQAQFGDPDDVLAMAEPPKEALLVDAAWHYARGVAFAKKGNFEKANAELATIQSMIENADFSALEAAIVPGKQILRISAEVLQGRIAQIRNDFETAGTHYEKAVELEDDLPYMEPAYWYYPVRQSLGAVLLQAGRPEDAERVFVESLVHTPNNAWALWGLMQAQEAADDPAVDKTAMLFNEAWIGDEEALSLDRL